MSWTIQTLNEDGRECIVIANPQTGEIATGRTGRIREFKTVAEAQRALEGMRK